MLKLAGFGVALALCLSWNARAAAPFAQEQFSNLLDIRAGATNQPAGYFFSDLGDWHGYGFQKPDALATAGALRGPAFVTGPGDGLRWLSNGFERLSFTDADGNEIPYTKTLAADYLPGQLRLSLETDALSVAIREIAISNRTTMCEYTVVNKTVSEQSFSPRYSGSIALKGATIVDVADAIVVQVDNGKHHFVLSLPAGFKIASSSETDYHAAGEAIKLAAGQSAKFYTTTSFCPFTAKAAAMQKHPIVRNTDADAHFAQNQNRWEGYLSKLLSKETPYLKSERNRNWAVKAMMTLNTNWRSAAGDLKHDGVVPGTGHFDAFWAWDSWEHAVALSIFNPDLAKDQMRTMFDFQTPEGMIIDLVGPVQSKNNTKCSKPPLAGWATYMVYQRTKDVAFVKEMFPKLMKFHDWRFKYRDHDHNGLCEYGGTGGEVMFGQWESGMDVAVKFDGAKMLENSPGAFSMDQESIELNSYLCAEKFYLAALARVIGETKTATRLRDEGQTMQKLIQEKFFDAETGYFYDRKIESGELVKIIDISGWIPLFTHIATPAQAAAVKKNMLDPDLFGTYFPFSTLNHKHPKFDPGKGYFRGQTWMNYTYFGIRGFKNYGYTDDAKKFTAQIPDKFKGIADPGFPIRESYNSATGNGLDAMHFSWSSAFSILLLTEDADAFPYVAN